MHRLLIVVGVFLIHALFFSRTLAFDAVDDAYISFRYAQNLAHGHGLVFNPGERVEGYTNFLWTVLLAPFIRIGLPAGPTSIVLGLIFAIATLWLVTRFPHAINDTRYAVRRSSAGSSSGRVPRPGPWREAEGAYASTSSARRRDQEPLVLLAAALLAVDGSFVLWSVSGMETALFAFLVLAGTLAYLHELRREPRFPWSGLLFAAAAMTRPEGLFWFGLTMAHAGLYRLVAQRRLPTWSDLLRIAAFGVVYGGYFLWRYDYYGYLLPNTFYAKVTLQDTQAQYQRGLEHARAFAGYHLAWITVPLALLALGRRRAWWWASHLILVIAAYVGYIIYVGGDWSVGRFFVPILAPFYLLMVAGIGTLVKRVHPGLSRAKSVVTTSVVQQETTTEVVTTSQSVVTTSVVQRETTTEVVTTSRKSTCGWRVVGSLALAGLLASIFWGASIQGEYRHFIQPFDAARATRARTAMGHWLRENVPPGTLIAVDAAGQVPYHSGLPAVDLFGITDPQIAHLQVETMGEGTPGHEKFGLAQVLARRPAYIIIYGNALDGSSAYRRLNVRWTDDPELYSFLSIYRRIE